ncbi:DUF983 domain-containing protein [Sphingomonas sp.]|uniref:DUF983 domain-containing protein n=1 Tax=Sphingomonas sp. TaxID=28214 RepID=UPI001B11B077|nr:DUF983 domain-containing protein [Sphingomonas sp.]MBO9714363.1 DUF983 domain-containing protein [Sphingomonas sp.]
MDVQQDKFAWIMKAGWHGLCPRCGKGHMFRGWLRIAERCEVCGLDYRFAAPDDGPAFFSMSIAAFPLTFVILWIQVAFNPPLWVHFVTSLPLMAIGCALPLRPIKGWLVASQYVNKAQESGTGALWAKLDGGFERQDGTGTDG